MMKTIKRITGLIGLILLTGCSHDTADDNGLSQGETPITFNGILPEEVETTRADEPLSNKVQTFKVWSYKNDAYDAGTNSYTSYQTVIPGFDVSYIPSSAYTTTSNTNNWEYVGIGTDQTIKYWDWGANAYRFFGVTNWGGEDNGTYEPNKTYGAYDTPEPHETYTLSASVNANNIDAAPYFTELWFSTGNPVDYADKQFGRPVQLRFTKPFARVRFMFTFVEGLSFGRERVKNIKFYPTGATSTSGSTLFIATSGNVKVTYPLKGTATSETWTTTNTQRPASGTKGYNANGTAFLIDYYETPDPAVHPADGQSTTWPNTPKQWYTVLPANNQGSYTLEACVVTEQVKTVVIPAEYMQWKAGYQYTYKFKITETGAITMDVIQVAINDWSNKQSSGHTVYNW